MLLSAVLNENLKEDLSKALEITWKGVLAIFIVIAIVIIAVSIMSVITKKIENAKQLKEQAKNAENNGGQNQRCHKFQLAYSKINYNNKSNKNTTLAIKVVFFC